MKAEFVNPFAISAVRVLEEETEARLVSKGSLLLKKSLGTSKEVTVLIGVSGELVGFVIYSLSEDAACRVASQMIGERVTEIDEMAQSALAELGNMITGNASMGLEEAGFHCHVSPPSLIIGKNVQISTIHIQRMVIPLTFSIGVIDIEVALQETGRKE